MTDIRSKSSAGIVERLRSRKAFFLNGGIWLMLAEPDSDCQEAADEIERWAVLKEICEIQRLRTSVQRLIDKIYE